MMSVKNETHHSSTITSTRLQQSNPLLGEAVNVDCWGPENVNLSSPSMAWLSVSPPPLSDLHRSPYRADPSTGAFCLFSGYIVDYEHYQRIAFVLRWTIRYNATGQHADDRLVYDHWERDSGGGSTHFIEFADVPDRISKRGLGSVMTSITAALNNLTLATSDDRATGNYVVRERVLEVRWPWLAPLFLVELLGMGYLLFIIFRPRSVAVGGAWKDSILAVLYHGLDNGTKLSRSLGPGGLRDMRKVAQSTKVHLERKGADGRVVLVQDNDDDINCFRGLGGND
ncbi:hypothetical protein QBC32DRAFT_127535 [Pseudoneurospora amorphoporcata]|uniref:Uncharacterized protein n=1 Tax=Pseudoneurospora amorphoporcata TaxID=241081 RepID=A0AAN6NZQ3_9PEZI|nr:hypothetical protein QBC32DRAFT_127535 [Pseudoneurospora amorphoporcata]